MATWSAFSGGIWVTGRRVLRGCCRRRWRVCCRFWALFRLDFFIVTRLLKGSIARAMPLVRTGRQTSAQLDDKGDAIVYRRSMPYRDKHHVFRERLPHGSEETPTTAS